MIGIPAVFLRPLPFPVSIPIPFRDVQGEGEQRALLVCRASRCPLSPHVKLPGLPERTGRPWDLIKVRYLTPIILSSLAICRVCPDRLSQIGGRFLGLASQANYPVRLYMCWFPGPSSAGSVLIGPRWSLMGFSTT